MCSFVNDERPEKCEAPYVSLVEEVGGFDDVGGTDEPVKRGEGRSFVVHVGDGGGGIARDGHYDV